jgi:hypothetical protein
LPFWLFFCKSRPLLPSLLVALEGIRVAVMMV